MKRIHTGAALAAMLSVMPYFGHSSQKISTGSGKRSRSKWTKPHQGSAECARRRRQMANGTHGYPKVDADA